jgi:hypothetical protein
LALQLLLLWLALAAQMGPMCLLLPPPLLQLLEEV